MEVRLNDFDDTVDDGACERARVERDGAVEAEDDKAVHSDKMQVLLCLLFCLPFLCAAQRYAPKV